MLTMFGFYSLVLVFLSFESAADDAGVDSIGAFGNPGEMGFLNF